MRRSNPKNSAIIVSAISSARDTSTWTRRVRPRSEARAESTEGSEEPRHRRSCQGRRRRWAARGRKEREWRRTAEADSILASERRLRGTCSTVAMPDRESCSRAGSSMQFRVTTKGGGGAGLLWWGIAVGDLEVVVVLDSRSLFTVIIFLLLLPLNLRSFLPVL